MRTVSVIIPNLNSRSVGATIDSVRRQLPAAEIFVIGRDDDGLIGDRDVAFVRTERVYNPAEARNRGVRDATGETLLFIDADCEALDGWSSMHLDAQAARPGVVGGAVIFDVDTYWASADNIASFHSLLPGATRDHGLGAGNMSVDRSAFLRLGGFDEQLVPCEDFDFSMRAQLASIPVVFESGAVVRHAANRCSRADMMRHARWYGSGMPAFHARYPDVLGRAPSWRNASILRLTTPIKAVVAAAKIFHAHKSLRRSLHLFPGVALFKFVYYLAAASAMESQRAEVSTPKVSTANVTTANVSAANITMDSTPPGAVHVRRGGGESSFEGPSLEESSGPRIAPSGSSTGHISGPSGRHSAAVRVSSATCRFDSSS